MLTPIRPSTDPKSRWKPEHFFDFDPFTPSFYGRVALGNVSQFKIAIFRNTLDAQLFVAIESHGAYEFNTNYAVTPEYVANRLGLVECDAANVADIINCLGGAPTSFGSYDERLCTGWEEQHATAKV